MTPTCLVARAGPCDAESASTQEDDHAALCWQALRTTVTGQPGSMQERLCRHANHWKCPVVIVSIPLARAPWKRASAALSVDRQSKSGVNFRRTRRRASVSGCRGQERLGKIARTGHTSFASFQGTPPRFATVAVRYARGAAFDLWCRSCQATSSITSSLPLNEIASPAHLPSNSA